MSFRRLTAWLILAMAPTGTVAWAQAPVHTHGRPAPDAAPRVDPPAPTAGETAPAPQPAIAGGLPAAPPGASLDRLSLAEVLAGVLRSHPDVRVAAARARAAALRPAQERALPDPMVSAGYASAGRPYPGAGLGEDPNAYLGLMVSQEIPYFGKRERRAVVMQREADAEHAQIEATRLALIGRAKQAYYRLAAAWQLDDILRANQQLLTTLLQVSETRYAVGQAAQQDVIRAQTQISLLALQRERIARERRTREGELNALLDRAPDAPLTRPVDLAPIVLERALPTIVAAANEHSPMLRRDRLRVSGAEAAVAVAQRDFLPDFAVSAGYNFMGAMPDMFEARVDVVVPLRRARRRAAMAEREQAVEAERQAVESTRLTLQGRLQEDYEMARTAGQLATLYRDAVLPQARLALESSVSSYQTGAVDFLSVLTNFGSVLEYEMSYVEQLTDLHLAASRLEEMAAIAILP